VELLVHQANPASVFPIVTTPFRRKEDDEVSGDLILANMRLRRKLREDCDQLAARDILHPPIAISICYVRFVAHDLFYLPLKRRSYEWRLLYLLDADADSGTDFRDPAIGMMWLDRPEELVIAFEGGIATGTSRTLEVVEFTGTTAHMWHALDE